MHLFNNYYDCETNQIKKVSCFLETLTNYTNNYNLCMMLTSSNCSLNDIDKTNLSRAFALKTDIDIKSIDELSELINKELQIYIENLLNDDLDIENLKSRLFRPVQYIKINGFDSGENFDATVIDVYSIILNRNKEIHSISRKKYAIKLLCLGDVNYRTGFKEIEKKEYDDLFQKTITLF